MYLHGGWPSLLFTKFVLAAEVCSCSPPNRRAQLYSEIAGSWGVCSHFAQSWKEIAQCDTAFTRATAGIPYREQSPKTKEKDVIMILSSLAYITQIRLLFCMATTSRSLLDRGGGGENFRKKKKKLRNRSEMVLKSSK